MCVRSVRLHVLFVSNPQVYRSDESPKMRLSPRKDKTGAVFLGVSDKPVDSSHA